MWLFLVNSKLGRIIAAVGAALFALMMFGLRQQAKGRKDAIRGMKDADQKQADDIRRNVRDVGRVRDVDITYRD